MSSAFFQDKAHVSVDFMDVTNTLSDKPTKIFLLKEKCKVQIYFISDYIGKNAMHMLTFLLIHFILNTTDYVSSEEKFYEC